MDRDGGGHTGDSVNSSPFSPGIITSTTSSPQTAHFGARGGGILRRGDEESVLAEILAEKFPSLVSSSTTRSVRLFVHLRNSIGSFAASETALDVISGRRPRHAVVQVEQAFAPCPDGVVRFQQWKVADRARPGECAKDDVVAIGRRGARHKILPV